MEEIWKDVEGYEGLYQVSSYGRVKSLSRVKKYKNHICITKEIILRLATDKGYKKVGLTNNKVRKTEKVHRLVANAFLGVNKHLCVNHKDCNRSNNNIENLEWVTHLENVRHARENNRFPKLKLSSEHIKKLKDSTSKKVICLKTGIIYNSATEASIAFNIKRSTLIHYLIGSRTNKTTLKYL